MYENSRREGISVPRPREHTITSTSDAASFYLALNNATDHLISQKLAMTNAFWQDAKKLF